MSSSIAQIRAGLVSQLRNVYGLNVYGAEPGQITPPAAVVVTPSITYHTSFSSEGGLKTYEFRVLVLVAQGLLDEAAHTLDTYADPSSTLSVRSAIEKDPTLGGIVDTLVVSSFRPMNAEEVTSLQYWGGEFLITVYAR